jgi:ribosomal protein S12 methylthiotransferase
MPAGRKARRKTKATDVAPAIVSLVSLGCAKNLVDSERILGQLAEAGFLIAEDPADAELCLVNTCGFIHDAREESAGVLRELALLKRQGSLRFLIALGCLVERATDAPELAQFLEAADLQLGFHHYPRLADICHGLLAGTGNPVKAPRKQTRSASYTQFLASPRLRIGAPHSAFLKISEGCSNPCRFCSIPRMRGPQVSRPIEEILAEARALIEGGALELNLIAQDTTSYGRDWDRKLHLHELLAALAGKIRDDVWFRLLYSYPRSLTSKTLDILASDPRFCPYIDIPLQHINDKILQTMGRGVNRAQTETQLKLIDAKLPGAALRTTFIVGYPGETQEQFQELLAFVKEGRFTHAGVFLYSTEVKTPAAMLTDDVPLAEKQRRRQELMLAQLDVSRTRLRERVGLAPQVLIDGTLPPRSEAPAGACAVGRSQREAPEVDGVIFLRGKMPKGVLTGRRVEARVVESMDYDLVAEPVQEKPRRRRS